MTTLRPHTSHWGSFGAAPDGDGVRIEPHPDDPTPSPILRNMPAALAHRARVARPAIRRGWLERGPGPDTRRGSDEFVEVSWETAWRLTAAELRRVYALGAEHVYGGSYGWASAGRFHHAQSQVHRFLNLLGGYVRSVNSYSAAAAEVILPRVIAPKDEVARYGPRWSDVVEHAELVVAFGGMPIKNAAVDAGGVGRHRIPDHLRAAHANGVRFALFSPIRDDVPLELDAAWHPIRPGTDLAVMLALAHVLLSEGLVDRDLVGRLAVGLDGLEAYVLGIEDDEPKTPEWAERISTVPASAIRDLAREMAARRTLIVVSQSVQRAEFGERPIWMGVALATLLGEIGLPGRGFSFGLGTMATMGNVRVTVRLPTFPQGRNPVAQFIPVARVSDMLLDPGGGCRYDGQWVTYPDIRLVYWAGGNPFHHQQDLARLTSAFQRPDTVIVHESFWTATARQADIVLPATMTLERDDIGGAGSDAHLAAMHAAVEPFVDAKDDFAILAGLARELGCEDAFTEGRSADEWLRHLYGQTREAAAAQGCNLPDFEAFWRAGEVTLPTEAVAGGVVPGFRADPAGSPLPTPSGKVELFSATIAGFGDDECPGLPTWVEPIEWQGGPLAERFPLLLIANQPARRLHSQLDFGAYSAEGKVDGRETLRMHPADAGPRGIATGDVVRVFSDRGACLAVAALSDVVAHGIVQMPTGSWYTPAEVDGRLTCLAGNPNAVTADRGSSRLAQGSTGQHVLVEVERFEGVAPAFDAYAPPTFVEHRPG